VIRLLFVPDEIGRGPGACHAPYNYWIPARKLDTAATQDLD